MYGVDAHSILISATPDVDAVRFAHADSLEQYTRGSALQRTVVSNREALEESFFLGLRLTRGISLRELCAKFGEDAVSGNGEAIADLVGCGLIEQRGNFLCLTSRGRLLSNEVFERFILVDEVAG